MNGTDKTLVYGVCIVAVLVIALVGMSNMRAANEARAIGEAIEAGVNPIAARCAIVGTNGIEALCLAALQEAER
jgi:hypothetical protein